MVTVQYVIDTICANFTVDSMCDLIKTQVSQGPVMVAEIAREIRCEDRTLDFSSSKMLAEAALEALEKRGDIVIEGDCVYLAD
jgi:hypothetical protein|tara:strand:+ start:403 stop:651 length:249 start_codon:yes stop_codon:yes gene_type:complete